jgi:hypothetical protein
VSLAWSRLTEGGALAKLVGDRGAMPPILVSTVDQFGAVMRDRLDELDMPLVEEQVIFHIYVTLAMVVDVAWHLRRDDAISLPQLSAVVTSARVIAAGLADFLPAEVRP